MLVVPGVSLKVFVFKKWLQKADEILMLKKINTQMYFLNLRSCMR